MNITLTIPENLSVEEALEEADFLSDVLTTISELKPGQKVHFAIDLETVDATKTNISIARTYPYTINYATDRHASDFFDNRLIKDGVGEEWVK